MLLTGKIVCMHSICKMHHHNYVAVEVERFHEIFELYSLSHLNNHSLTKQPLDGYYSSGFGWHLMHTGQTCYVHFPMPQMIHIASYSKNKFFEGKI